MVEPFPLINEAETLELSGVRRHFFFEEKMALRSEKGGGVDPVQEPLSERTGFVRGIGVNEREGVFKSWKDLLDVATHDMALIGNA